MPWDRFGKALRTRPEIEAVCKRPAYCGPIKSSQVIKFKTGPIKPKFNGGKRLRPNSKVLVKLSLFYFFKEHVQKQRGHLVFFCA